MSKINKNKEAALSLENLKRLLNYNADSGEFTWRKTMSSNAKAGQVAGSICKDGYRHIKVNGVAYKAHRLAWFYSTGEWPESEVDHKYLNKDDNRISTIRKATPSQNSSNRGIRSDNSSGYKGVSWNKKSNKWSAEITSNGQRKHLGYFEKIEDASAAYKSAATEQHGQFSLEGQ